MIWHQEFEPLQKIVSPNHQPLESNYQQPPTMNHNYQNMFSQNFQQLHNRINQTGSKILQFLQEFRRGKLTEGDKTQGLEVVENNLVQTLQNLQEQKYQVAVVAAMKAGKSTFLNAVIGADILASENAACTICRTDIKHISNGATPRLLEYRELKEQPVILVAGSAGEIQQKFLERTREIREKNNPDKTIRFEVEHPIEAISQIPSLAGFSLLDTPGPNEWESANFNTVKLKQTALEALRTCNAILFILNYTSYKDNAILDLFKEVVENRKEILNKDAGKVYFILNKVDLKTKKDPEIPEVINELKQELINFGFPNPRIYPAISRQGLLAKLIIKETATEFDIEEFEDSFSAKYSRKNEKGRKEIPLPSEIAPQALIDSNIPEIEKMVIQTITQNSGVNLLEDVLARLEKVVKGIEDSLNTQIQGWEIELETLKQKVEEYAEKADRANQQVLEVKKLVKQQEKKLIERFGQELKLFATDAKEQIKTEIEQLANSISDQSKFDKPTKSRGGLFREIFQGFDNLFNQVERQNSENIYKIRFKEEKDAEKLIKTINEYCSPHIQNLWVDVQDKMTRQGTKIREDLATEIQSKIQEISNQLSVYLGEYLQIKLNINPIIIPLLNFEGMIDDKVDKILDRIRYTENKQEVKKRNCKKDEIYFVNVEVKSFEVDLQAISQLICRRIDEQLKESKKVIDLVIQQQVKEDFRSAEMQIKDYTKKFQSELEALVWQRESQAGEAEKICSNLQVYQIKLSEYVAELDKLEKYLDELKKTKA
ncbi:dynamin family protein [Dapis sp. BLCC M172]|uniref:dynamin family protein n=1 Tax=Dapis sp. BLCC M172 TaxID=2975281 RepID=UPI003CF11C2A